MGISGGKDKERPSSSTQQKQPPPRQPPSQSKSDREAPPPSPPQGEPSPPPIEAGTPEHPPQQGLVSSVASVPGAPHPTPAGTDAGQSDSKREPPSAAAVAERVAAAQSTRGAASGTELPSDSVRGTAAAATLPVSHSDIPRSPQTEETPKTPIDRASAPPRRVDTKTGQVLTYPEFVDIYGEEEGKAQWDTAGFEPTPNQSPRGSIVSGRGSSSFRSRGGSMRGAGGASYRRQKR
eukprot:Hpha_TRINITY_DN1704_c0_g1::TRINITY_DN1704_c0_g1_i1::g.158506::m.158506